MVLKNIIKYESSIPEIKEEADIIKLLNEVARDLNMRFMNSPIKTLLVGSRRHVLEIIEKGEYETGIEGNVHQMVDLSAAKRLIDQYKVQSGRTCRACSEIRRVEGCGEYCGRHENQEDSYANGSWDASPRVMEYSARECSECKPRFRPLEDVLEDLEPAKVF